MLGQVEFEGMVFQVGDYFWGQMPRATGIWCRCAGDEFNDKRLTVVVITDSDVARPVSSEMDCFYWMYCGPIVRPKECRLKAPVIEVGTICLISGVEGEWRYMGPHKAAKMDSTQHVFANMENGRLGFWGMNSIIPWSPAVK